MFKQIRDAQNDDKDRLIKIGKSFETNQWGMCMGRLCDIPSPAPVPVPAPVPAPVQAKLEPTSTATNIETSSSLPTSLSPLSSQLDKPSSSCVCIDISSLTPKTDKNLSSSENLTSSAGLSDVTNTYPWQSSAGFDSALTSQARSSSLSKFPDLTTATATFDPSFSNPIQSSLPSSENLYPSAGLSDVTNTYPSQSSAGFDSALTSQARSSSLSKFPDLTTTTATFAGILLSRYLSGSSIPNQQSTSSLSLTKVKDPLGLGDIYTSPSSKNHSGIISTDQQKITEPALQDNNQSSSASDKANASTNCKEPLTQDSKTAQDDSNQKYLGLLGLISLPIIGGLLYKTRKKQNDRGYDEYLEKLINEYRQLSAEDRKNFQKFTEEYCKLSTEDKKNLQYFTAEYNKLSTQDKKNLEKFAEEYRKLSSQDKRDLQKFAEEYNKLSTADQEKIKEEIKEIEENITNKRISDKDISFKGKTVSADLVFCASKYADVINTKPENTYQRDNYERYAIADLVFQNFFSKIELSDNQETKSAQENSSEPPKPQAFQRRDDSLFSSRLLSSHGPQSIEASNSLKI